MKQKMREKIEQEDFVCEDSDVRWLMSNIGDEDPIIRDEIVFIYLANGIMGGYFSSSQYRYIINKSIKENLLFYHIDKNLPYTLTRSFTALLNGFIIEADGTSSSRYYHYLSEDERNFFFESAIEYLTVELDKTDYSSKFGWVHAFAHGADFLSKAICHDAFPQSLHDDVFASLSHFVMTTTTMYKEREECRVAHVILEGLTQNVLTEDEVTQWINSFCLPIDSREDVYRLETFKYMLAYIYFHIYSENRLGTKLEQSMMEYLKDF